MAGVLDDRFHRHIMLRDGDRAVVIGDGLDMMDWWEEGGHLRAAPEGEVLLKRSQR
jgi:hypothetical protein